MANSLDNSIQKIVTKRQERRGNLTKMMNECIEYRNLYLNYLDWIKEYEENFDENTKHSIQGFKQFLNSQMTLINDLISTGDKKGALINLLARSERTWISLGTVGAKRQGKGHFLASTMGLKPENDLFLARKAHDACTATVVTLHQGNKLTPVFDKNNKFLEWEDHGTNFVEVKYHTVQSMAELIQKYFDKIHFNQIFSEETNISVETFVDLCKKWLPKVKNHIIDTNADSKGDVDYVGLLKNYLEYTDDYTKYLTEPTSINNSKFEVPPLPIPSTNGEKLDYKAPKLRKLISYYGNESESTESDIKHYDALAVKHIDVYLPFQLGGCEGNAIVLSDSAGVGEDKLDLIDTLQKMLSQETDLAIAISKVPTDEGGALTLSGDIKDFHLAIKECLIDFPTQMYYLINVSNEARTIHNEQSINLFKTNVINHLRQNKIGIPTAGMPHSVQNKRGEITLWSETEVAQWENEHIVVINCDDNKEINRYLEETVLTKAATDISILDTLLLNKVDLDINTIRENHKLLHNYINPISSSTPTSCADIYNEKQEFILDKILIPMGERLNRLCCLLTAQYDKNDKNDKPSNIQYDDEDLNVIEDSIKSLKQYEKKISDFYYEIDGQRILHIFNETDPEFSDEEKKKSIEMKADWYKQSLREDSKKLEEQYCSWFSDVIKKREKELRNKISFKLSTFDALTADEIVLLSQYRKDLIENLCATTTQLIETDISQAYVGMTNQVWKIIYKLGRFDKKFKDNDKPISTRIEELFKKDNGIKDPVLAVLETLHADTLSESKNKLKEDFDKCMLEARIQPLTYDFSLYPGQSNKVRTHVIPLSIITHLQGIERDYKKKIGRRCLHEDVALDFISRFNKVVGELVHQLCYEKSLKNENNKLILETKAKKSLVGYYLDNFTTFCSDSSILKKIKLKEIIDKLNNIK